MNPREAFTRRGLGLRIALGVAGLAAASCVRPLESGQDYLNKDVYFAFHQLDTRWEAKRRQTADVKQTRFTTDSDGDSHIYSLLVNGSVCETTFLQAGQRPGAFPKFREIATSLATLVDPALLEITEGGNIIIAGGDKFDRSSTTPLVVWNKREKLWQKIPLGGVKEVSQVQKLGDTGKYLIVGNAIENEGRLFVVSNLDDSKATSTLPLKGERSLDKTVVVLEVDTERHEAKILVSRPGVFGLDFNTFDYETGYLKDRVTRFSQLRGSGLVMPYRFFNQQHVVIANRQNIYDFDIANFSSPTSFPYGSLFKGEKNPALSSEVVVKDLTVFETGKKQYIWFGGSYLSRDLHQAPFVAFWEVGTDLSQDLSGIKVYDLSPFARSGSVEAGSLQQVKMYNTLLASFIIKGHGNVLVPLENGVPLLSQAIFLNRGLVK